MSPMGWGDGTVSGEPVALLSSLEQDWSAMRGEGIESRPVPSDRGVRSSPLKDNPWF
jgi:hypothetical protein